jgi:hypothetical protein
MRNPLWLFFDLGNTLVNEETAMECRIQRVVEVLARYGRRCSFDEVRCAFQEASAEFAPRLSTRAIEKLLADPAGRHVVAAEARYPQGIGGPLRGGRRAASDVVRFLQARRDHQSICQFDGSADEMGADAVYFELPLLV